MLLQANDYLQLYRKYGTLLQLGGSDQWGNIVAGVDLIRKKEGAAAHALTLPLVTDSEGRKFGKSRSSPRSGRRCGPASASSPRR